VGFPILPGGRQVPPATTDSDGRRLGLARLIFSHVSLCVGATSVDDYGGPGFTYGAAIYVPFTPQEFFLRDLRVFVGQRVREGQYGRFLWGIAWSKKI
jgi:hypothetical protein